MLCLFAASPSRVRCLFPTEVRPPGMGRGWGAGDFATELDELGCAAGCAAVTDAGELVVGNDSGVLFYSYEGRRAAYLFAGRKQRVAWFRGYLVLAAEEAPPGGRS